MYHVLRCPSLLPAFRQKHLIHLQGFLLPHVLYCMILQQSYLNTPILFEYFSYSLMKPDFNKSELHKLNSILFHKNHNTHSLKNTQHQREGQRDRVRDRQRERDIEQYKQNSKEKVNGVPNLHDQMQTLKREVQTMLEVNQHQAVEKVIRSTTRYYLEKIKNISVELPQSLDSFKEAAGTFLESLPLRRRPLMKTERSLTISKRFGLKLLFKALNSQVLGIQESFMRSLFKLSARRSNIDNTAVYSNQAKKRTLSQYFSAWSTLLKQNSVSAQHHQTIWRIEETIALSELLMSEEKTISKLQEILSREVYCQIMLVEDKKLITYCDKRRLESQRESEEAEEFLSSQQPPGIVKHEIPLKESLTKMCLTKKEITQTNTPNSDPDFSSIDYPLSFTLSPQPNPIKHPLLFIPILQNNTVIAVLRYFSYPTFPNRFGVQCGVIEFVRSTISTCMKLNRIMLEYKERQGENERMVYCRLLGVLEKLESSCDVSMREVLDELRGVIDCESLVLIGNNSESQELIYPSCQNGESVESIVKSMETGEMREIVIQNNKSLMGVVKMVKPQFYKTQILESVFKHLFQKQAELRIQHLQEQNIQRQLEKHQLVQTKLQIQRIIRMGLGELASFNTLNIIKVVELLVNLLNITVWDVFVRHESSREMVSGVNHLMNQAQSVPKEVMQCLSNSTPSSTLQASKIFTSAQVLQPNHQQNITLYNLAVRTQTIGQQNVYKMIISLGVPAGNSERDTLVRELLESLGIWLEHLGRISDTRDTLQTSKILKGFKENLFDVNQQMDKERGSNKYQLRDIQKTQDRLTFVQNMQLRENPIPSTSNMALQLVSAFNHKCFNIEQHTQGQVVFERNRATETLFSTLNQHLQSALYSTFNTTPSSFSKTPLFTLLNHTFRTKLFHSFHRIVTVSETLKVKRRMNYQNLNHLISLTTPILSVFNTQTVSFIHRLKEKKQKVNSIFKGVHQIQGLVDRNTQRILSSSFYRIHNRVKRLNLEIIYRLTQLVNDTKRLGFQSIRKYQISRKNTDCSLVSCLTFPQQFTLLKNILTKSKELTGKKLLLENTNNSMLILLSPTNTITVTETLPHRFYRVEFSGFNLVWKLSEIPPLSLEQKQYLETISKIVSENVGIYQQLIFPVFTKLNLLFKSTLKYQKSKAIKRWRDTVLHHNKLRQYTCIEKAYRINNEVKSIADTQERRNKQTLSMTAEKSLLEEKLLASEEIHQYQQSQIQYINKCLAVSGIFNFFKETEVMKRRANSYWAKWRLAVISQKKVRTGQREIVEKKQRSMMMAGLKEILVVVNQKLREVKDWALKEIVVFYMKEKEEQERSSNIFEDSVIHPHQEFIIVEEGSFSIQSSQEDMVNLRIPTISSIVKEESILSKNGKILETRYYSVENSRSNLKRRNNTLPMESEKQNLYGSDNYFEPSISDIKTRMINNYLNKSVDGSTFDERSEVAGGYRLGEKTLKFLKRYGKGRLNTSLNQGYSYNLDSKLESKRV